MAVISSCECLLFISTPLHQSEPDSSLPHLPLLPVLFIFTCVVQVYAFCVFFIFLWESFIHVRRCFRKLDINLNVSCFKIKDLISEDFICVAWSIFPWKHKHNFKELQPWSRNGKCRLGREEDKTISEEINSPAKLF